MVHTLAVAYAGALVGLALCLALHLYVAQFSFVWDALLCYVMCACKIVVACSAHAVHRDLSPTARAVVGRWLAVLAASKLVMALGAARYCRIGSAFCWSLLLCVGACGGFL
eukprot:gene20983-22476_t